MDFDFSWLPAVGIVAALFFALGWWSRRTDVAGLVKESRTVPDAYFKGLNFLLNNQHDKALDTFLQVSKDHPQTVELQFALANLFRRRGEIDRAIRLHSDLAQRTDIPDQERDTARYELAIDYLKAGVFDRAEDALQALAKAGSLTGMDARVQAGTERALLDIYIQEKDWAKAIDAARALQAATEQDLSGMISNFYCELALEHHRQGHTRDALENLEDAIRADTNCVRANIIRGEWHAQASEHRAALSAWLAIEQQSAQHLGLVAQPLYASFQALGEADKGLATLHRIYAQNPSLDVFAVLAQAIREQHGDNGGLQAIRELVEKSPSLVGLDKLIDAQLAHAQPGEPRDSLVLLKQVVSKHAQALSVYLCDHCGFRGHQYYWQCPACGTWDSFPPRRTAELETAERHLARLTVERKML
jgi:lipopolysaccharide assembly protein B